MEMMVLHYARTDSFIVGVTGPQALGDVLMSSIVTGLFVAISITTGGGALESCEEMYRR